MVTDVDKLAEATILIDKYKVFLETIKDYMQDDPNYAFLAGKIDAFLAHADFDGVEHLLQG